MIATFINSLHWPHCQLNLFQEQPKLRLVVLGKIEVSQRWQTSIFKIAATYLKFENKFWVNKEWTLLLRGIILFSKFPSQHDVFNSVVPPREGKKI